MSNNHIPVLLKETIDFLNPVPNEIYVDCTLDGGGHALEILKKSAPSGKLIGIDKDDEMLRVAKKNLKRFKDKIVYIRDNFRNLKIILDDLKIKKVDGILLDLGPSIHQLKSSNRGFSFEKDAFLDMRMDKRQELTASTIVNTYPETKLRLIFKEFGEEPYAKSIARMIVKERAKEEIRRVNRLLEIIKKAMPPGYRYSAKTHFATSIFRALRITVNNELNALKECLEQTPQVLKKKAKIVIISFHSLEDRIVKNFFLRESKNCICPSWQPICTCKHHASLKILTKKPVSPSRVEIIKNPRSRSAKLRTAEKL
jgi:16S rRNA (cytosine1402-N4)-methyltransferase